MHIKRTKFIRSQCGYTLLEMVVAVAIFAAVMLMATGIFQSVIEGQRNAISGQNIQENMKYLLEVMSKEIRTAIGDQNGTPCGSGGTGFFKTYDTSGGAGSENIGTALYFQNKNSECVVYYLDSERIKIKRDDGVNIIDDYITPNELRVTDLYFEVVDDRAGEFHSTQPRVTIKMDVEAKTSKEIHKLKETLQTTVSSRYYH